MPLIRSVGLRGGGSASAPPPGDGPDGTRYYVPITVPAVSVADTLTNFPVFVDLGGMPTEFWLRVQADGGDIRVTEGDGVTRCAVDLVTIDTGAETGELHFLAASLSDATDNEFRLYYNSNLSLGQPAVSAANGRDAVWADEVGVWHLQESPTATAPQFVDSTGRGHSGTAQGSMTGSDSIAGKLSGRGIDFDGSNDYISVPDHADLDLTTAITLRGWLRNDKNQLSTLAAKVGSSHAKYEVFTTNVDPDRIGGRFNETNYESNATIGIGAWKHVALTWDGTNIRFYVDGVEAGSHSTSTLSASSGEFRIGRRGGTTFEQYTQGAVDEVRLRATALGVDHLAAEFANQSDPGAFYTIGTEQTA